MLSQKQREQDYTDELQRAKETVAQAKEALDQEYLKADAVNPNEYFKKRAAWDMVGTVRNRYAVALEAYTDLLEKSLQYYSRNNDTRQSSDFDFGTLAYIKGAPYEDFIEEWYFNHKDKSGYKKVRITLEVLPE